MFAQVGANRCRRVEPEAVSRAEFLDAKSLDITSHGETFCAVRRETEHAFDVRLWHKLYAAANAGDGRVNWQDDLHEETNRRSLCEIKG